MNRYLTSVAAVVLSGVAALAVPGCATRNFEATHDRIGDYRISRKPGYVIGAEFKAGNQKRTVKDEYRVMEKLSADGKSMELIGITKYGPQLKKTQNIKMTKVGVPLQEWGVVVNVLPVKDIEGLMNNHAERLEEMLKTISKSFEEK